MGVPQVIYTLLLGLSLGMGLANDGKPKVGNSQFWIYSVKTVIQLGLLFWGGFYGRW